MFKMQSEAEVNDTTEKFKRMLTSQLEEQRGSHAEELRRSLLEAEARATELRVRHGAARERELPQRSARLRAPGSPTPNGPRRLPPPPPPLLCRSPWSHLSWRR